MDMSLQRLLMEGHRLLGGGGGHDDDGCDPCNSCTITKFVNETSDETSRRFLGGDGDFGGVHVEFICIFRAIVFLTAIYVAGKIASKILKMPDLVGEILAGIILGPPLLKIVPFTSSFVLLGEIGLILLVLEAGVDVNVDMLKLIGTRGFIIAILGSIFPIVLGLGIAFAMGFTLKEAIATGAAFGPTSLGIALNILKGGGVLNTPVGQLIIAAAIIDDMIALLILSQLPALKGNATLSGILIPVISAVLYLFVGSYLALMVAPGLFEKFIFSKLPKTVNRGKAELGVMLSLLIALMPATKYSQASPLMGAFVAGLAFCSSPSLHHAFVRQFKRIMQWLMRIFFAASIGFQVPITQFANGEVIWKGVVLTLALLGKLGAGFLVPNFYAGTPRFTGLHFRDCLITGFSLAAEGEFAFVIAFNAVNKQLIEPETYSSIVLAVLVSTIVPPFALRYVINKYNQQAMETVAKLAENEEEGEGANRRDSLQESLKNRTAKFWCLQTQSESSWGLLHAIMNSVFELQLEVIDHRSWHPRGVHTTLVNEMYVRDKHPEHKSHGDEEEKREEETILQSRAEKIQKALLDCIQQPENARVKVTPWYPGVVTDIVESDEKIGERLIEEAEKRLETKEKLQKSATQFKTVQEILSEQDGGTTPEPAADTAAATMSKPQPERSSSKRVRRVRQLSTGASFKLPFDATTPSSPKPEKTIASPIMPKPLSPTHRSSSTGAAPRPRRNRQKVRSTPVYGGSLFGEETKQSMETPMTATATSSLPPTFPSDWANRAKQATHGHSAKLSLNGETYHIRISEETAKSLKKSNNQLSSHRSNQLVGSITMAQADAPIVNMLQGYVRANLPAGSSTELSGALTNISEDLQEDSMHGSTHGIAITNGKEGESGREDKMV